jgi:ATP-binding cassette subfamily F protein 3
MIKVTELSKSYGAQVLFKDLSFTINTGERIGLVGRNGYGKTTLFKLLLGQIEPDSGEITIPNNYRIGHLEQHIHFTQETVLQESCLGLRSEERDASWKAEKILAGLGFAKEDMQRHPSTFSGGYQLRLNLAKTLLAEPDLLLLDEPNNYLDIVTIRWLENFLRAWKGELMVITHDRQFMDSVTTHTMILHRQRARKIEGSTEKMYEQIAQEEEIYEKTRQNDDKKRRQTEIFIRRFRAKARLGGLVQSRIKCLEKQEKRDKLEQLETLEFSFTGAPFTAAQMSNIYNLVFSYDGKEPYLINRLSLDIKRRERICIIGRNGKGKSTLLKLIAGELKATSGNIKTYPELKTGYFCQTNAARLNDLKTIFEEIADADPDINGQRVRDICGAIMFGGDRALKKIEVLSGGERSRVLLGKLLATPCHLLLLDEPTNHLDLESCDALIDAIDTFDGSVIMVTHNEMYLHRIAERLVIFDNDSVRVFDGSYQDFLDRVGWTNENEEQTAVAERPVSRTGTLPDKKAQKRAKAELLQERARVLKPLEQEMVRLEAAITSAEAALHASTEQLVVASSKGDAAAIATLAKQCHDLRPHIEELYESLDKVTGAWEATSAEYRQRIECQ